MPPEGKGANEDNYPQPLLCNADNYPQPLLCLKPDLCLADLYDLRHSRRPHKNLGYSPLSNFCLLCRRHNFQFCRDSDPGIIWVSGSEYKWLKKRKLLCLS
jgi:hypothetical protein